MLMKVGEDHIGKTHGLCGVYDGNAGNDFTTKSSAITSTVEDFANSWAYGCKSQKANFLFILIVFLLQLVERNKTI